MSIKVLEGSGVAHGARVGMPSRDLHVPQVDACSVWPPGALPQGEV